VSNFMHAVDRQEVRGMRSVSNFMHAVDRQEVRGMRSVSNFMHAVDRQEVRGMRSVSNFMHAVDRQVVRRGLSLGRALILLRSQSFSAALFPHLKLHHFFDCSLYRPHSTCINRCHICYAFCFTETVLQSPEPNRNLDNVAQGNVEPILCSSASMTVNRHRGLGTRHSIRVVCIHGQRPLLSPAVHFVN